LTSVGDWAHARDATRLADVPASKVRRVRTLFLISCMMIPSRIL
jgi:hypothetical protein